MNATQTVEPLDLEKYQLLHFTDPILNTKPDPFNFEEKTELEAEMLGATLFELMKKYGGVGLSANQVGIPTRVFIMGDGRTQTTFFNPSIISVSKDRIVMEEGCLSFPGFTLNLSRPSELIITYQNPKGEYITSNYRGLSARVILHEYDHMEGRNFTHHASPEKLRMSLTRWKKRAIKNMRKQGIVS